MSARITLVCPRHPRHRYNGQGSIKGGCWPCQLIQHIVDLAGTVAGYVDATMRRDVANPGVPGSDYVDVSTMLDRHRKVFLNLSRMYPQEKREE